MFADSEINISFPLGIHFKHCVTEWHERKIRHISILQEKIINCTQMGWT
jgi:hypothetical protein